ncbi:pilus assembly protein PilM [Enterovibrio sp. ZSDZ35]|uniref:Pilus assembly protein PilM n=1 Tax=Enterovibrio qingdaonensis TaxID=2899818 RepID=A0ABT5QMA1_9GAMM|nr:pilus assembly protein PilM [Enterovibrio sp. ZSDZ35]MDD1782117.1 pilus assembly protein PilM [Enterovibrio sp. ZSDZ35]
MFRGKWAIGLDIGNHSVRAALLESRSSGIVVRDLCSVRLEHASLGEALKSLRKKFSVSKASLRFATKSQVMGIAQSSVAIKRLPASQNVSEQEQYMQIGLQLSESLGLAMDDLLYDYRNLPSGEGIEVFACRKSVLEPTFDALAASGFRLSVVELESHALLRLYGRQQGTLSSFNHALMADINTERLQLCFGVNEKEPIMRDLPLPISIGLNGDGGEKAYFTEQIADTIRRQCQLVRTQFAEDQVTTLWLSGEGNSLIDKEQLEGLLGWDVQMLNPIKDLICQNSVISKMQEPASYWSTAVGLALRGMDDEK